jgi:arsenite-transporting ATPase
VGGKGGVGKTTCAAAAALRRAQHGRTLLVSTDPASSLADAFGVPVGRTPRRVPGVPHLELWNLDAGRAFRRWLSPRADLLSAIALRGTYLDREDVARFLRLSVPGVDEVAALLDLLRASSPYTHVVVDTAPTGHTLRLLATPSLYARVASALDALQAHHREMVSAIRGRYREDAADHLIAELDRDASRLSSLLRDGAATAFVWVTLPEPMALEETRDAIRALAADGIRVGTLIVNRLTPVRSSDCEWDRARRRFESRALVPLSASFPDQEVRVVPEQGEEPVGLAALADLANACRPFDRATRKPPPLRQRVYGMVPSEGSFTPRVIAPPGTRWILFGGKGGVGKTTCAAALALRLAAERPGERFLLMSSDPAHSLADAIGHPVSDAAAPVPDAPANLDVREIDAPDVFASFRRQYTDAIESTLGGLGRGGLFAGPGLQPFRDLIDLAPPGIDEVVAASEAADLVGDGSVYRTVISDTAPTAHALRLLQTPALLRDWTRALMALLLKYQQMVRGGELSALLVRLSKRLRALEVRLRDRRETAFVIVARAAALPRAETIRLRDALDRLGIAVRAVVLNGLGGGSCPRCVARAASERRELRRIVRQLGGRRRYAIIEAPAALPPPHGVRSLIEWTGRWHCDR